MPDKTKAQFNSQLNNISYLLSLTSSTTSRIRIEYQLSEAAFINAFRSSEEIKITHTCKNKVNTCTSSSIFP